MFTSAQKNNSLNQRSPFLPLSLALLLLALSPTQASSQQANIRLGEEGSIYMKTTHWWNSFDNRFNLAFRDLLAHKDELELETAYHINAYGYHLKTLGHNLPNILLGHSLPNILLYVSRKSHRIALLDRESRKAWPLSIECLSPCTPEGMAHSWKTLIKNLGIKENRLMLVFELKPSFKFRMTKGEELVEHDDSFVVLAGELWPMSPQRVQRIEALKESIRKREEALKEESIRRGEEKRKREEVENLPRLGQSEVMVTCLCIDEDLFFDDITRVTSTGKTKKQAIAKAWNNCNYADSDLLGTGPFYLRRCKRVD